MESNEGARPSDPRRASNEGAPPADPERRRGGGPPWGKIIAALVGLLLLALLIPLACSALGGGAGDPGGAGNTDGEQQQGQGAEQETTGAEQQAQGGGNTGAAGGASAPAGEGTSAPGGGTTGGEVAQSPSAGAATGAALETGGQQSGDGTTVTVPRAEISGTSGWLAIHADDDGRPGEVLGHAPLQEGENADVAVRLDKPVPSGRLYAMVHADEPNDERYTFPDGDPPVEANGQAVVEPIQYTATGEQAGGGDLPASGGPNPLLLLWAVLVAALLTGTELSRRAWRR